MPKKKKPSPPSPEQIAEANRRHDAQFAKQDLKAWRGKNNKVYERAERASLGTGWSNRSQHQDNWTANSNVAKDAVLRNQIKIKQMKKNKNA